MWPDLTKFCQFVKKLRLFEFIEGLFNILQILEPILQKNISDSVLCLIAAILAGIQGMYPVNWTPINWNLITAVLHSGCVLYGDQLYINSLKQF